MSSLEFLKATSEDTGDIFLLDLGENDAYSKELISQMIFGENNYTIVAKECGKVVGYASFSYVLDEAELIKVVVDRGHRRQGVASALLQKSFYELKKSGVKSIFLEVRVDNESAKKCYEKLGFEHYYTRQKYYNGIDAMLYRLKI